MWTSLDFDCAGEDLVDGGDDWFFAGGDVERVLAAFGVSLRVGEAVGASDQALEIARVRDDGIDIDLEQLPEVVGGLEVEGVLHGDGGCAVEDEQGERAVFLGDCSGDEAGVLDVDVEGGDVHEGVFAHSGLGDGDGPRRNGVDRDKRVEQGSARLVDVLVCALDIGLTDYTVREEGPHNKAAHLLHDKFPSALLGVQPRE